MLANEEDLGSSPDASRLSSRAWNRPSRAPASCCATPSRVSLTLDETVMVIPPLVLRITPDGMEARATVSAGTAAIGPPSHLTGSAARPPGRSGGIRLLLGLERPEDDRGGLLDASARCPNAGDGQLAAAGPRGDVAERVGAAVQPEDLADDVGGGLCFELGQGPVAEPLVEQGVGRGRGSSPAGTRSTWVAPGS